MIKVRNIVNIIAYVSAYIAYGSVYPFLDSYHAASFVLLSVGAIVLERRRVVDIARWVLNLLSLTILFLAIYRIKPDFLVEPLLDALVILAAIKLLEKKEFRDYMQIFAICTFLLVGSVLVSVSMVFVIYFSLLLLLVTVSLILLAYFSQDQEISISRENLLKIAWLSCCIFLTAIPVAFLLFLILPRTNYPIFGFLTKTGSARTGFSDTILLGQVTQIQENNEVVFRAETQRVGLNKLYWRGVVLDRFDGVGWKSSQELPDDGLLEAVEGQEVVQTIYLEPYGHKYLFALDRPVSYSIYGSRVLTHTPRTLKGGISERLKYRVTSRLSDKTPQRSIDLKQYLQLPQNIPQSIVTLVHELTDGKTELERIRSIFQFLHRGDFKYSLDSLPFSNNPLEEFLFSERRGNCEYFASAFAVMLRLAGIPARLIGGYRGGEYSIAGNYYLIMQKHAHVWVEAHTNNREWLRIDPTPPPSESNLFTRESQILTQLRLLFDTFNYHWYKLVIGYDFSKQLEILRAVQGRLSRPQISWNLDFPNKERIAFLFGFACIAFVLWYFLRRHTHSAQQQLISTFLRKMALHGYRKEPGEGLEEFLAKVADDSLRSRAAVFVEEYEQIYYRDMEFTRERIQNLSRHLQRL